MYNSETRLIMQDRSFLPNLRCINCNGHVTIKEENSLICERCGENYPVLDGIPFIGSYTKEDLIGLIEISEGIENSKYLRDYDFSMWEQVCSDFHITGDEERCKQKLGKEAVFFQNRYIEWLLLRGLLSELNLKNKKILDVGAGAGADTWRLMQRGGIVTALEYSPFLACAGNHNLPDATWIGGFAHILPFQDNVFDMVFCNAALHHMRDVSGTIREFLRVVKPDGIIITSCDSFSSDNISERDLLQIFDSHPDTLTGVNENVPRIKEFLTPLIQLKKNISVNIITSVIYNQTDGLGSELNYFAQWSLKEFKKNYQNCNGSLCVKIIKNKNISIIAPTQTNAVIKADTFYNLCLENRKTIAFLSQYVSEKYVNMSIPHPFHDKFLQLCGWRLPKNALWQEGYGRIYLFFTRCEKEKYIDLEFSFPETGFGSTVQFSVNINNEKIRSYEMPRGVWIRLQIPISHISVGKPFLLTLLLGDADAFDRRIVRLRNWDYSNNKSVEPFTILEIDERPGLQALLNTTFFNKTELNVLILPGQKNLFRCFGLMRKNGVNQINVIIPNKMSWLIKGEENIKITLEYETNFDRLSFLIAQHPLIDLVLVTSESFDKRTQLFNLINLDAPFLSSQADKVIFWKGKKLQSENFISPKMDAIIKKIIKSEYFRSTNQKILVPIYNKINLLI